MISAHLMSITGPTRTERPAQAIGGPLGPSGPAGLNNTPPLPLEQKRNSCPYRPASREMSLMLAIPHPKNPELDLNRPSKGRSGDFRMQIAVSHFGCCEAPVFLGQVAVTLCLVLCVRHGPPKKDGARRFVVMATPPQSQVRLISQVLVPGVQITRSRAQTVQQRGPTCPPCLSVVRPVAPRLRISQRFLASSGERPHRASRRSEP